MAACRNIVVSIDMKRRKVLTRDPEVMLATPLDVIRRLNGFPIREKSFVEPYRVGTSFGLDTNFLEKAFSVKLTDPLIWGGGVESAEGTVNLLSLLGFRQVPGSHGNTNNGKIPLINYTLRKQRTF